MKQRLLFVLIVFGGLLRSAGANFALSRCPEDTSADWDICFGTYINVRWGIYVRLQLVPREECVPSRLSHGSGRGNGVLSS